MIEFPVVSDPYLGMLVVCSHLRTKDLRVLRKLKNLPSGSDPLFAQIRRKPDPAYAMIFGDGPRAKKSVHLHVNIVRPRPYASLALPEINSTMSDMVALLENFSGQSAYVTLTGVFFVPARKIPRYGSGFIGMFLAEDTVGRITLQQTAGTVSIAGGPELEWALREDKKEVRIEVREHSLDKISERYLVSSYKRVRAAFHDLVAVSDGKTRKTPTGK